MNVLKHPRNERNPCLKQNRPDRSYRDTLLSAALAKSAPLDFPSEKSFLVIRKCKTKMEVQFRFSAAKKKKEKKICFIFLYN